MEFRGHQVTLLVVCLWTPSHPAPNWAVWECVRALSEKYPATIEYLENWSCGLDVTWQRVTGDLTVHP